MILLYSIFNTVEFYIILSVIAASVIAYLALPQRRGEVKTHLIAGELNIVMPDTPINESDNGSLIFECHPGNFVSLRRTGLKGIASDGALSLVVNVSGFDITIEERVTPGGGLSFGLATSATFLLDFLAPEWYHIRYESEHFNVHASLTLHVREGIRLTKNLIS